jgi:hypothetical protein
VNPLAVLGGILAIAVFPGAVYAGTLALAAVAAGRIPPGLRPAQLDELLAAVGVAAACGLLAFPGSPLLGLPTGVSVAALLTALAAGIAWGTAPSWPWARLAAAAAATLPLLTFASSALTMDLRTIAAAGGSVGAARPWAVAAILLAVPAVVRPFDRRTARPCRAALVAAAGLLCFSLAGFDPLATLPSATVAGVGALTVLAYSGLLGGLRRLVAAAGPSLGVLAILPAAVAVAIALR